MIDIFHRAQSHPPDRPWWRGREMASGASREPGDVGSGRVSEMGQSRRPVVGTLRDLSIRISRRSQLKFAEMATELSTLQQIGNVFEGEGFQPDLNQGDVGGQRRTLCAAFQNRINPLSDNEQRRLLNVYLDALDSWGSAGGRHGDGSFRNVRADELVRSLQRDGIPLDDGGRLTGPLPAGRGLDLGDFRLLKDPGVLGDYLERMENNIKHDTPAVIGAAKELVEAVCKLILEDRGVAYSPIASMTDLYRAVAQELKLARESVPASSKASEAAQRVLQGLVTTVQNLAELRNNLGLGHGRARRVPALERHARLAMNASHTVTDFLLATWHDRQGLSGA